MNLRISVYCYSVRISGLPLWKFLSQRIHWNVLKGKAESEWPVMTNDPKKTTIKNNKINVLASYSSSRITSCFFWSIFTEGYHDYLGLLFPFHVCRCTDIWICVDQATHVSEWRHARNKQHVSFARNTYSLWQHWWSLFEI